MFLITLSILSNVGEDSVDRIEEQMFLMNCPLPIFSDIATLNSIDGYSVNYTITAGEINGTDTEGTRFICSIDSITGNFQASTSIEPYGEALFDFIPFGWLGYLAHTLTDIFARLQAMFTLVSFFVSPTGFNILGFTLDDLTGFALLLVISIYGLCYLAIGVMMYKILSPFAGGI